MVSPVNKNYSDFPKCTEGAEGMKTVKADISVYNVRIHEDIVYHERNGVSLKLKILVPCLPENHSHFGEPLVKETYTTIVYVPGSAWHKQQVNHSLPTLYGYAKRGYVVVLAEYCSTDDDAVFPMQIYDVKKALEFIQDHAESYYMDPENIILFGDSSGAHTALMAGITNNHCLVETEDESKKDFRIKGIIDFYGPTDIRTMNEYPSTLDHTGADTPEGWFIGKKNVLENQELSNKTVIKNYVKKDQEIPPIFMLHGNKDRLVCFHQSVELYQDLKAKDKEVEFYCLDGADHGGSCFWTDEIIDLTMKFITKCTSR